MILRWLRLCVLILLPLSSQAQEPIKLGLLKFGTVNWEMDVIRHHALDQKQDIALEIVQFASSQGSKVALLAGAVDVIVADWVWVAHQRSFGRNFSFIPYSTSVASLVVPNGSSIKNLSDLDGTRLGIAGGPMDKTWILLQALIQEEGNQGLDRRIEKVFGAPPLINKQILTGRVDATINFWHFVARLEAQGLHQLLNAEQIVQRLGVEAMPPMLGFVFNDDWAKSKPRVVTSLQAASRAAKTQLCGEMANDEWARIRPLTRAKSDAVFNLLQQGYCRGVPQQWGPKERANAEQIFSLLVKFGGDKLVGKATKLPPQIFWSGVDF